MISRTNCAKCGSGHMIPNVRVLDHSHNVIYAQQVVVDEKPNAVAFKGPHFGTLQAWICGTCGYTELYVDNPEELYAAYLKHLDA